MSKNQLSNETVRYKNELNRCVWRLTTIEHRIILIAMSKVHDSNLSDKTLYEVTAKDLIALGTDAKDVYRAMQNAVETLYSRSLSIPLNDTMSVHDVVRWVQRVRYNNEKSSISLQFSEPILPFLRDLQEQFTRLGILDLEGISSTYAIRLYCLLMQFAASGWYQATVDELRHHLNVGSALPLYADFKRNVLEVAKKQINKGKNTQIRFKYEQIKEGRRVTSIKFFIEPKNNRNPPDIEVIEDKIDFDWRMNDDQAKMFADKLVGLNKKANAQLSKIYPDFDNSTFVNWFYRNWEMTPGGFAGYDTQEVAKTIANLLRSRPDFVKKCYEPYLKYLGFKPTKVSD